MLNTTPSLVLFTMVHLAATAGLLVLMATYAMPYHFYFRSAKRHDAVPAPVRFLNDNVRHVGAASRVHDDAGSADALNAASLLTATAFHVVMAVVTYVTVSHVMVAPFGRHASDTRIKVTIPARLSWALQESPAVLNIVYFVFLEYPMFRHASSGGADDHHLRHWYAQTVKEAISRFHLPIMLFAIHYVHRSFFYPLAVSSRANRVPLHVTWSATLYCLFNGRLQVLANLALFSPFRIGETDTAARDFTAVRCFLLGWRSQQLTTVVGAAAMMALFLGGSLLFFAGMHVNMKADYYLVTLRKQRVAQQRDGAAGDYQIPHGGWFERVSCPNFLGEIVEWGGYVLVVLSCTWFPSEAVCAAGGQASLMRGASSSVSPRHLPWLAASSFVVYVLANLVPRGIAHHLWYLRKFGDAYAKLNRSAVFPW